MKRTLFVDGLLTALMAGITYIWTADREHPLFSLLGGVEDAGGGEINILALGKWLFLTGFFLLMAGRELVRRRQMFLFCVYRYGDVKNWWTHTFLGVLGRMCILYMEAVVLWGVFQWMETNLIQGIWQVCTFGLHMLCLVAVVCASGVAFSKNYMLPILLVAEGILCVLAVQCDMPVFASGMYYHSSQWKENGFSIPMVYFIDGCLIFLCYVSVMLWNKKGDIYGIYDSGRSCQ